MKKVLVTGTALLAFAATGFAQFNEATLNQAGLYNDGKVYQSGINHDATINQNGNGSSSSFNKSTLAQEGVNQGAVSTQTGHGHEVNSLQRGQDNNAYFTQDNANSYAFSRQYGQNNYISSSQISVDGTAAKADFLQEGNRNRAYLVYQSDQVIGLDITTSVIKQRGNDHVAYLTQLGDANAGEIYQSDNWGYAWGYQSGNGNKLRIDQKGSATFADQNKVDIYQYGNFNQAKTYQDGVRNRIGLVQSGNGNNYADINQFGSDNVVRGTGGDTFARQMGVGNNRLESLQTGNGQTLYVNQNGNTNMGFVRQTN
ncbi:hypothetical protein [Spirosoma agri]|uniref:Curlin n=1 Tax=Spirosoma agri TaxID=1987381 RepID=A0A6M0IDT6_9BACT|nr:hypothetical protein [Spirosoma agri]NEU65872.1 hypothetical protein [Spirosoma agri]